MKIIFWLSLFLIIYTYVGYPSLLFIWSKIALKKVNKKNPVLTPLVSVVIAVRNEEKYIEKRILNLLNQDYPIDKMEIIIVSDGSLDASSKIVKNYLYKNAKIKLFDGRTAPKIRLIELKESKGKPNALNIAIQEAVGDFIILTDARQQFCQNVIMELISNFNDESVGCVSGELKFYEGKDFSNVSLGMYWEYEKWIRKMEGEIHSVVGATGAIYAIRKKLFYPIPQETLIDDVLIPMNIVLQGYRTVFDKNAVAYDIKSKNHNKEKRRKIRTLVGNYQILKLKPDLLKYNKNPIFFRFISHKLIRLFVPHLFLMTIAASFMLNGALYKLYFVIAIFIIISPVLSEKASRIPHIGNVVKLCSTFVNLNYFALLASIYAIWHKRKVIW